MLNQDFYSQFAPCKNVNIPLATSLKTLLRILIKKHLRNVIRVSVLGLALYKVSRVKVRLENVLQCSNSQILKLWSNSNGYLRP